MDTLSTLKAEVKEYIDKASEYDLKKIIDAIDTNNTEDWWDSLPLNVKKDTLDALKQADNGQLISHDTIKENYKQWLAK